MIAQDSLPPPGTSCGVVVSDGIRLLMGHSTGNRHWDLPKGLAEAGENPRQAAARELREETGLAVDPAKLISLYDGPYRPGKPLVLFLLPVLTLPDPATLVCSSLVHRPGQPPFPEIDAFATPALAAAPRLAAKAMAGLLADLLIPLRALHHEAQRAERLAHCTLATDRG